jgi:hypothetical protein
MKKNIFLNILIGIVGLLLAVSLASSLYVWLKWVPNPNTDDPIVDDKRPQISIVDYEVYADETLPFAFVLGEINIKSEEAIDVAISDFVTTQQINLNEVNAFLDDLLAFDINLRDPKHELDFDFSTNTTDATFKLFIPLRKNGSDTLTVFFKGEQEISVLFDLTNNQGEIIKLVDEDENQYLEHFVEEDSFDVKVISVSEISATEITRKKADGTSEEVIFPSTARILGVLLDVKALGLQAILIDDAHLSIPKDNQNAQAFGEDIEVFQFDNLFKKPIIIEGSGFLFFDVYAPSGSDVLNEPKEIKIKLNVYDEWLTIKVE